MKQLKIASFALLTAFLVLSFATRNNFNPNGKDWLGLEDDELIKATEVIEMVQEALITPITNCYRETNPHAFMMKCTTAIRFEFDYNEYNVNPDALVYAKSPVAGELIFIECEQRNHLAQVFITPYTKEIKVRESYFSPIRFAQEYVTDFCKNIAENKAD